LKHRRKPSPAIDDSLPESVPALDKEDKGLPELPEKEPGVDKEKIEEEVEGEVRKEKEDEVKLDTLSEKLDKLTENMESMVSALADQKEIIEKVLLEKNLLKKKVEEISEEPKDFTSEEFGVDTDNLVLSKNQNGG